jgi:hypothetical protein
MPKKEIVKHQPGVEERIDLGDRDQEQKSGVTRREFLQKGMMVTSGLALGSMLPAFTAKEWVAAAQATTCQAGQTLMPIMEIAAHYPTAGLPGTMQAVI